MDRGLPIGGRAQDALAGISSLRTWLDRVTAWRGGPGGDTLAEPDRSPDGRPFHALVVKLQRIDTLSRAYGEWAGDTALAEAGARIVSACEDEIAGEWVMARDGGAFLLAATGAISRERWQWLGEALLEAIARPIPARPGHTLRLSAKLAMIRGLPGERVVALLERLDRTLDRLDHDPARLFAWADGGAELALGGLPQLEADLLGALDRGEIEVVYQPQYACADDRLTGAEALARWSHPTLGQIGAGTLFAVAARAGHTTQVSRHIARLALEGAALWPGSLRLSLNVTPPELAAGAFADTIERLVADSRFPADRLTIEITEQTLLTDLDRAAASLDQLVGTGIRIALDDFGAGFCNFRYLKLLPLHYLKLDKAMIEGIATDPRDLAVLRGIVTMADALGLSVIAEGIENERQLATVRREGCASYQGFLRAEPLAASTFAELALAAG